MTEKKSMTVKPGPLPPTYFLICIIIGACLHLVFPVYQLFPGLYRLVGVLPFVLGGWITVWADRIFKQRGTTVKPYLEPSVLVTTGPFDISRHPMYLGMTLITLAIAVFLGSLSAFVAPIAIALVLHFKFIAKEEQALQRVFGKQYTSYKQRVRAWL